jgi:hypothetical protein
MHTGATLSESQADISTSRTLQWTPQRGTEGRKYQICFTADDVFGMRSTGKRCVGATQFETTRQDDGCRVHEDCGVRAHMLVPILRALHRMFMFVLLCICMQICNKNGRFCVYFKGL